MLDPTTKAMLMLAALMLGLFGLVAVILFIQPICQRLFKPNARRVSGPHVAEVWMDWDICRGSTMYRQRFATQRQAWVHAKLYAVLLDWCLPKDYRGENWSGRPVRIRYDFEIKYGVRRLSDRELNDFHCVWSTTMPGHGGYQGEHRESHPLLNVSEDSLKDLGFKV